MRSPMTRLRYYCIIDLTADFDTVDHDIFAAATRICIRLQRRSTTGATSACQISNAVCPFERHLSVLFVLSLECRNGPYLSLFYSLYTADIRIIMRSFGLKHHTYADDNQIYSSCFPAECVYLKINVKIRKIGVYM